jgi:hypothetical protein
VDVFSTPPAVVAMGSGVIFYDPLLPLVAQVALPALVGRLPLGPGVLLASLL